MGTTFAGVAYPDSSRACGLIHSMVKRSKNSSSFHLSTFQSVEAGQTGLSIVEDREAGLSILFDLELTFSNTPFGHLSHPQILIELYRRDGKKMVEQLEGNFAFVIIDSKKSELFLARDRLGKKSLFWTHQKDHFIFSNELKVLLGCGLLPKTLCKEALAQYLFFGYFSQESTPIEGVYQLLPAYTLTFYLGKRVSISRYWSLSKSFQKKSYLDRTEAEKQLEVYYKEDYPSIPVRAPESSIASFLEDFIQRLDIPIADPTALYYYHLIKHLQSSGSTLQLAAGKDDLFSGFIKDGNGIEMALSRFSLLPESLVQNVLIPFVFLFSRRSAMNLLRFSKTLPWQFEQMGRDHYFSETALIEAFPPLCKNLCLDTFLHKFYNLPADHLPESAVLYLNLKTKIPDCTMRILESLTKTAGMRWESPFLTLSFVEALAAYITTFQTMPVIFPPIQKEPPQILSFFNKEALFSHFQALEKGFLIESGMMNRRWLKNEIESIKTQGSSIKPLWTVTLLESWITDVG